MLRVRAGEGRFNQVRDEQAVISSRKREGQLVTITY